MKDAYFRYSELKRRRQMSGLTQKDLATRAGVAQGMICCWEKGEYAPSIKNLLALSLALGCSVNDLLEDGSDE